MSIEHNEMLEKVKKFDELKTTYNKLKGDHSVYVSLVADHSDEIDRLNIENERLKKDLDYFKKIVKKIKNVVLEEDDESNGYKTFKIPKLKRY